MAESQINMPAFILVLSGEVELSINYKFYSFKKNFWVVLRPSTKVNFIRFCKDFSAKMILVSEEFVVDTLLDKKPIPISHFMEMKEKPHIILDNEDRESLNISIDRIFYYIKQQNHNFMKDMLHNTFYNFVLEASNIYTKLYKSNKSPKKLSRKEGLVLKFMGLIEQYARSEHSPIFYANKLFISSQYLSIVLKQITEKPANFWISKQIITEAKILLRTPNTTIQEVTDTLHFSDQSSFGKFFKKHTGISPKKYRDAYSTPR